MVHTVWHYVTRRAPGIGIYLTLYDAAGNEVQEFTADTVEDALDQAWEYAEEAGAILVAAASVIANATLDVVRGLGGAIVDGLDNAYNATRTKLEGHEPDVIAGLVVVSLTVLTGVYLLHSAKSARDAF